MSNRPDDQSEHERAHEHEHEHAGPGAAHGHGGPVVWDPEAGRSTKAKLLIAFGALLIVAGALLYWWDQPPTFAIPESASLSALDDDARRELERLIADVRARPEHLEAIDALATFYEARELWLEAEACLTRADVLDPENPIWSFRAAKAAAAREHGRGVDSIRAVLERFPDFEPARVFARELDERRLGC